MINRGMMSSNSQEWETPQELYDELDKEFRFNLDPCANENNFKCISYFISPQNANQWTNPSIIDGLKQRWSGRVFMNPPYGREINQWVKKAYYEALHNCEVVVCLLPARTDTRWFHDYCLKGEVRFLKGRLKFSNSKNSAPFPSMIVIFRVRA